MAAGLLFSGKIPVVFMLYNEVDVIAMGAARAIGQYSSQYFVLTTHLGSRKINR